jgi:acyl-CoA reductase-like NAD-dependent aldehyde dehydrogenase
MFLTLALNLPAVPVQADSAQLTLSQLEPYFLLALDDTAPRQKSWRTMTPEERKKLLEKYRRFNRMDPEDRKRIEKKYRWFKKQPPEKRRELKEQWKRLSSKPLR